MPSPLWGPFSRVGSSSASKRVGMLVDEGAGRPRRAPSARPVVPCSGVRALARSPALEWKFRPRRCDKMREGVPRGALHHNEAGSLRTSIEERTAFIVTRSDTSQLGSTSDSCEVTPPKAKRIAPSQTRKRVRYLLGGTLQSRFWWVLWGDPGYQASRRMS